MKLLDEVLKKGTEPSLVKIKIPKHIFTEMKKENRNAKTTMWLHGIIDGQFYLSPDDPGKNRKLIKLPNKLQINELLKAEVVKIIK